MGSETGMVLGQKLVWVMSTIGVTNTPSFVKIREVTLQFLSDLTWNDPILYCVTNALSMCRSSLPGPVVHVMIYPRSYSNSCYKLFMYYHGLIEDLQLFISFGCVHLLKDLLAL